MKTETIVVPKKLLKELINLAEYGEMALWIYPADSKEELVSERATKLLKNKRARKSMKSPGKKI